jgi:hypothetical protein
VYKDKNEIRMTKEEFEDFVLQSSDESEDDDNKVKSAFRGRSCSI